MVMTAVRPAMATPPATIAATRRREVFGVDVLVLVVMVVVFLSARPGPSVPTGLNLPRILLGSSRPVGDVQVDTGVHRSGDSGGRGTGRDVALLVSGQGG